MQYRDIIRDRPTICIPDDHDVGHGNVWGESKRSTIPGDADGGYKFPVKWNQVQRQQTSCLPDPADPKPVNRGIGVYFTSLNVGGVDFAILEDRKFKTGPAGKIPKNGPRPDNPIKYDPNKIDLPGLQLLGPCHKSFSPTGLQIGHAKQKGVLFATAFGCTWRADRRLLADLDCKWLAADAAVIAQVDSPSLGRALAWRPTSCGRP